MTTNESETLRINGFTVEILDAFKSAKVRSVRIRLPYVDGGRVYKMTSYEGAPVELSRVFEDKPAADLGSPRDYFPGDENSVRDMLRACWLRKQPSKAAALAFPK
jgi:hypothetical protein